MTSGNGNRLRLGLRALCLSSVALAATSAAAQTREGAALQEVVVTARKTTENVQDVPVSVNVISGEALMAKGVTQLSNISALAPNLVWSDAGGGTFQNRITLRGIYSNATSQGFDPGVGVYVDDVYVGNQFGFNAALLDTDRIEVLKGPQGTLFGRNTSAGAISLHTRRPSTDKMYATVAARVGNYDLREGRALVNVPISQMAAFKVSAIYRDREGYKRNIVDGKRDINDEHFYGGRAQLLVTPSDAVDVIGSFDYFKNDDHQDIYSCVAQAGGFPCPNPTRDSVFNDIAADNNSSTKRTSWGASVQANWRPAEGFEVTSITAVRSLHITEDQDQDYTALDLVRSGFKVPKDDQFSQELRLSTPQDKRLRGVVGAYYFHESRKTLIPLIYTPTALGALGVPNAPASLVQTTFSDLRTSSWAAFGQVRFDIVPTVTAEAGLRYTKDKKDFTYEQSYNATLALVPPPVRQALFLVPFPRGTADDSSDRVTTTASLTWRPTETVRVYGSYATGFKAGGFQAATNSPDYNPLVPFDPERSEQFEAGIKSELYDRRVRLNVAFFTIDYKDIQVQITDPITRQKIVGNFGAAKSEGAELETSILLAEGLTFDGNVGFQRSRFVSGTMVGRVFQYVPRATASAALNYEREVREGWKAVANVSLSYRSAINLNTQPTTSPNFLRAPELTLWNGRVGVESEDAGWGLYLWGANLTNDRRFTNFTPASPPNVPSFHTTSPRTYGVEVKATF
jgi:iron complex outermembrane receptor protein